MVHSNISNNSNEPEEVPCCRVCHGESEPNNPLFYPCKCDGSIKYVHQECLVQWLKVSSRTTGTQPKCELCGETFHFQNIYAVDAPNSLTILDIGFELIPRAVGFLKFLFKVVISCFSWGLILPLFTNWWVKLCWCSISEPDLGTCWNGTISIDDSLETLTTSWYSGIVSICFIIAVSVLCFELGQILYKVRTTSAK